MSRRTMPNSGQYELVRSPAWRQAVDHPTVWGQQHEWFLTAIFELFDKDGVWPSVEDVESDLADTAPELALSIAQLGVDLPHELGARHVDHLQLNVRGAALVPAAQPLLEQLVAAFHVARTHYPAPPGHEPVVHGHEIKSALELDDPTYRKLSTLFSNEGWLFKGGSGDVDGNWERKIAASILRIDGVETIQDYLDAVAQHRFGPAEVSVPVDAPTTGRTGPTPLRVWLSKREVSAGDLLLIGVIGSVTAGIVLWLITR